jgi:hypothetical protein
MRFSTVAPLIAFLLAQASVDRDCQRRAKRDFSVAEKVKLKV